jgi:hypothetical protein
MDVSDLALCVCHRCGCIFRFKSLHGLNARRRRLPRVNPLSSGSSFVRQGAAEQRLDVADRQKI